MSKDETENIILETVFEHNGFVCGGYIRDKLILHEPYKDMDTWVNPEKHNSFLNALAQKALVIVIPTIKGHTKQSGGPMKFLVNNCVVVDLLGNKPLLTGWDFDINSLALAHTGIVPLFGNSRDNVRYSRVIPDFPAMDVLSISSSIAAKKATVLITSSWIPDHRYEKFLSKGYEIIIPKGLRSTKHELLHKGVVASPPMWDNEF